MFELSEQQIALQRRVRQAVQEKVLPRAGEIDVQDEIPWDIIKLFRELGLFGLIVPREYGGSGDTFSTFCVVVEEIAKASGICGLVVSAAGEGAQMLLAGSEEQRRRYLPALVSAEKPFVGFALTEPTGGSDVASIQSRATLIGDYYRLNGTKVFISNGNTADPFVILAKTDPTRGSRGMSAFIMERDTPGFRVGRKEDKLGLRGMACTELILEDALIPRQNLLGSEGEGFKIIMEMVDFSRLAKGTAALGMAQGALDYVVDYVRQKTYGGKPLAQSQAVQAALADMAVSVEAGRSLAYRIAAMLDRGQKKLTHLGAMIKCFATDTAVMNASRALQILGSYGYTGDHPVERILRDAKGLQILEGTNQILRLVITRSLWGFR